MGFPGGASGKEPACPRRLDIRDVGSVPEPRRSPRGGHGKPLQYSCLEISVDIGAWKVAVTQSWTRLKRLNMHVHGWRNG